MVDEIIAKSLPQKTLKEHTEEVINEFNNLRKLGDKLGINFEEKEWKRLEKACFYHDFGKANSFFQDKIRKLSSDYEIPHNFLSLLFLEDNDELLLKIIAFHHWRDLPSLNDKRIDRVYSDVQNYIVKLNKDFNNNFSLIKKGIFKKRMELLKKYYSKRINGIINLQSETKFIILLGFLNRLDHSSSAGVPVESIPLTKYEATKNFLLKKTASPWQILEIKSDFKDKNGIVVASTGMGKTEMALLWGDSQKTFYTLPIRTSVTAMYRRLSSLFGEENVGLLHSEALSSLLLNENELTTNDAFYHYNLAKNLSYPLIVCTPDQLFSATLKYFGFEKIYATLSYSKVIVDEIQAYSPKTMAIITYGLNEIVSIGGKFLIITATFPNFLSDKFKNSFYFLKIPNLKKHKVELREEPLSEDALKKLIKSLQQKGAKKILIVCNTVKKSQQLYNSLKDFSPLLLHSRFTRIDRTHKENDVLKSTFEGILISTQVIEVSLDIDFEVLITELAPLDVLVQRMGRVYRGFTTDGDFSPDKPNVYVFTEDTSGVGTVYEKEIVEKSKSFLNNGVISEKEKFQMVDKFYSEENLKNTEYWISFNNALEAIRNFSVSRKNEAQKIFRDIAQIDVIPKVLLEHDVKNTKILNKLKLEKRSLRKVLEKIRIKDKKEKIFVAELIKDFIVPLPLYRIKTALLSLSDYIDNNEMSEYLVNIKVVDFKYDDTLGLLYEEGENCFFVE
ncbi:MAG: CRISPR-associated helicase Cas3' [Candidatus Omnitrophica bacterium]|nr:CRISPR-associated helicase Cas3' [Candidatus Omnitrophota bacterium]